MTGADDGKFAGEGQHVNAAGRLIQRPQPAALVHALMV